MISFQFQIEDGKFMAEKTKEINARKMYKDSALREKADKIIDMCSKEGNLLNSYN